MKQKLLTLLLVGVMMLGLVACSTSTQTPIDNSASSQSSEGSSAYISGENTEEPEVTVATIESTVLVDQDGIVITAQELVEDSIWGTGIKLLIENNSSENQVIQCDYAVVNNFMMTSLLFSADVAAGKKANETLYFSDTAMEGANISTITDMSFVFYSMNPNTYQRGFTTEEVSLSTSASGSYEQPIPDEGKELYNQNGIRIVGSYVEEDTFWGAGVVLFIENTSDTNMIITCDNMSINGFMVTPYFSALVNSGKMSMSNITIMSSDLEDNGIDKVEDIELVFKGLNPESYQTIFETDAIAFSTAE